MMKARQQRQSQIRLHNSFSTQVLEKFAVEAGSKILTSRMWLCLSGAKRVGMGCHQKDYSHLKSLIPFDLNSRIYVAFLRR